MTPDAAPPCLFEPILACFHRVNVGLQCPQPHRLPGDAGKARDLGHGGKASAKHFYGAGARVTLGAHCPDDKSISRKRILLDVKPHQPENGGDPRCSTPGYATADPVPSTDRQL